MNDMAKNLLLWIVIAIESSRFLAISFI